MTPRVARHLAEMLEQEGLRVQRRVDEWNRDHPEALCVYMLGKISFEMSNTNLLRIARLLRWFSNAYVTRKLPTQAQPKLEDDE